MRSRLFLTFLMCALVALVPARLPAAEAAAVTEAGLFTYQAPPGWTVSKHPSSKFPAAIGTREDSFTPNINVVMEEFDGTLTEYVAANLKALSTTDVLENVKLGKEKAFVTASGLEGVKLAATDSMKNLDLAQTFFFFDGPPGKKFVVTSTSLAKDERTHAAKFEASMKTFSLAK